MLHTKAGLHFRLGAHCAAWISREAAGQVDAGLDRRARFAVAQRDVAIFVHRDRRQPTIASIRIVGAGLKKRRLCRRASGVAKFKPLDRSVIRIATGARTTNNEPFVRQGLGADVAVSQPIHEVSGNVVQIIQSDRWWRLRHAVARRRLLAVDARCIADAEIDEGTG